MWYYLQYKYNMSYKLFSISTIIIFGFNHPRISYEVFLVKLKENWIVTMTLQFGIRLVTHKDINDEDIEKTISVFKRILIQM